MSDRTQEDPAESRTLDAQSLVAAMREIVAELHPHLGARAGVTLDSSLDRDLGLDSLSRMELLSRLERRFGVTIPETVMANAETARELLPALRAGERRRRTARTARHSETIHRSEAARLSAAGPEAVETAEAADAIPTGAATLLEAIDFHARRHGGRVHVDLYGSAGAPEGEPARITFAALVERAEHIAAGLANRGLAPGQSAALMLPTGLDYLATFLAVQMAGAIPVPIYPPARPSQLEDHTRRHAGVLANARARTLVTFAPALGVSRLLTAQVPGLDSVLDVAGLDRDGRLRERPALDESSTAFLQYTSGSTGSPKGVVLSHGDVLASLRAMAAALGATPRDVFVSWLPLYHDMGLIGAWMGSLYYGFPLVLMSPLDFLARPARWLEAIHRHRGTLSGGPNFAYELCVRRIEPDQMEGFDLSSWRLAFNGAEPVNPDTMDRFTAKFVPYGLPGKAMTPVYGLAEATLGVAFTPIGRGPRIDVVDAEAIARRGRAAPLPGGTSTDGTPADGPPVAGPSAGGRHAGGAPASGSHVAEPPAEGRQAGGSPAGGPAGRALRFVSCGPPIPGFEVRIVDDRGTEIEERAEGAVEFRGPSTTSGYFRNPAANRALFDGEWLRSGDRGYVAGGELYVTGRDKDLIVRAGRNLYPYDLEAAVGEIDGVRKGCVAVFAAPDPAAGTERLVVVAETRERDAGRRRGIEEAIVRAASAQLGSGPDEVVLAPPHSVLKTSSGKIRRVAVRELFESGALKRGGRLGADAGRPARAGRGPRHGAVVGAAGGPRRLHGVCRGGRPGDVRAGLARGGDGARERARPLAPRAGALPGRVPGPRHPYPGERRIEPGEGRAVRPRRQPRELSRRPATLRGDSGAGRLRREGRACRQRLPRAAPARARGRVRQPAGSRAQRRRRRVACGPARARRLAGLLPRGHPAPDAGAAAVPARRVLRRGGGRRPRRSGHHRRLALGHARRPVDPAPGAGVGPHRRPDRRAAGRFAEPAG